MKKEFLTHFQDLKAKKALVFDDVMNWEMREDFPYDEYKPSKAELKRFQAIKNTKDDGKNKKKKKKQTTTEKKKESIPDNNLKKVLQNEF
jgi:hypothetical protein